MLLPVFFVIPFLSFHVSIMKASGFRVSLAVLLVVFLGLFAVTGVHGDTQQQQQQIVLESEHGVPPSAGLTAEQVEQLQDTEKYTFQASNMDVYQVVHIYANMDHYHRPRFHALCH